MVFRPIVIAAHLRCGVVSDPWLPLDGILLYQAVQRYGGPPPASIRGGVPGGGRACPPCP